MFLVILGGGRRDLFSANSTRQSRTAINSSDNSKSILPPKLDPLSTLQRLERLNVWNQTSQEFKSFKSFKPLPAAK
jgi:hypothetical protein